MALLQQATFTTALESGGVSAFVFGPDPEQRALATAWSALARFRALVLDDGGLLTEAGTRRVVGEVGAVDGPEAARALEARVQRRRAGARGRPPQPAAAAAAAADAAGAAAAAEREAGEREWALVMDARDWKAPPGVSGPAAPSAGGLKLLAAAGSAEEARLMLEALQAGTGGVLLRTDDPSQVRTLVSYVARRAAEESGGPDARLHYRVATVAAVRPLGVGDRACVDLAGLMQPGEGLLVGNFARCLALVHSECGESEYIASRPFRVNAGPVHAYVSGPGGRTRYLSELSSGSEVLVADPAGRCRTALVGRVKIERRPLVLVELETHDEGGGSGSGSGGVARHSLMLQNAETVKLVGPAPRGASSGGTPARARGGASRAAAATSGGPPTAACCGEPGPALSPELEPGPPTPGSGGLDGQVQAPPGTQPSPSQPPQPPQLQRHYQDAITGEGHGPGDGGEGDGGGDGGGGAAWRAISVSALQRGDQVYVALQPPARHTGIAVEEFILEK
ncbi:hypothetical protein PLESTB_001737000 [Pleodorina starrii]|uniref:3-dehydroquinate synthase n=1 Tax=Pleodorina starrii TaxID=330485 RepID=A0A9W6FA35_9CHLO|nr:hypothetical protein PLESTB_001737000 [Pleodorina starrii]